MTSFSTATPPLGSGAFQLRPNSVRSTVRLEVDADPLAAGGMATGPLICPRASTGFVVVLDRQLAVDDQLAALGADLGRREGDLGIALGVEEVGRQQVAAAGSRHGPGRCPYRTAPYSLGSPSSLASVTSKSVKRAAEGGHDHVLDGEADLRMDGSDFQMPVGMAVFCFVPCGLACTVVIVNSSFVSRG